MSRDDPDEKKLVSRREMARVGQEIADRFMVDGIYRSVVVAETISGLPARVYADSPAVGHYTLEVGTHSLNFPGELRRLQPALLEKGVELSFRGETIN